MPTSSAAGGEGEGINLVVIAVPIAVVVLAVLVTVAVVCYRRHRRAEDGKLQGLLESTPESGKYGLVLA
jgi:heme/copper-type cytochrome/quinol oxidase subunit 2